jgi:uncharacterized protein (TIGR02452 family)
VSMKSAERCRAESARSCWLRRHRVMTLLGARGRGVFKNDPRDVAAQFQEALTGGFAGVFRLVLFAVLGHSGGGVIIAPFEQAFGGSLSRC